MLIDDDLESPDEDAVSRMESDGLIIDSISRNRSASSSGT
jgi:hypothetical protein